MTPLVTAIIPLHNHQHFVRDAIASIIKQDYRPLRLVVVDDGSTDESYDAVRRLITLNGEQSFPDGVRQAWGTIDGVPVILAGLPEARGPATARNFGMKLAWEGTDLFALLDSDDTYEQGKVRLSVDAWLTASEDIGVIYTDYDCVRCTDGLRLRQYKEPFTRERILVECIVNCDSLVSKAALAKVGLFDEALRVAEDWDLWRRITASFVAYHIPLSLVSIRTGSHSSTASVPQATWQECYRKVLGKPNERSSSS